MTYCSKIDIGYEQNRNEYIVIEDNETMIYIQNGDKMTATNPDDENEFMKFSQVDWNEDEIKESCATLLVSK